MRIAIDYTAAIRQRAGIGNYVRRLVDAMLEQDTSNQYTLLTSGRPTRERPFPKAENVHGRNIFIPDRYLSIIWYRWRLPLYANYFSGQVDIYHGPDFALPPIGKKLRKVVTVHDLAFLEHPEYAVPSLVNYLKKVVPEAVAAADVVCTVSQEVSRTLVEHFQTPRDRLVVIPNGVSAHFRRITDPVILGATRNKFGLRHPLVLGVGTLEPRKNHIGLIKAFYQAQKKTDVFAFPSFVEGFGVPPIEAMACGAPVITSNTSSLPEIVGDAALLIDPHNTGELSATIMRILQDKSLQEDLRQKGYERVKQYTWPVSARKMLSIYQKLYDGVTDFTEVGGSV